MSPESVKRLAAANGRRLLRVAPTGLDNEIELIFEARNEPGPRVLH